MLMMRRAPEKPLCRSRRCDLSSALPIEVPRLKRAGRLVSSFRAKRWALSPLSIRVQGTTIL
jgi:hypothetical protein